VQKLHFFVIYGFSSFQAIYQAYLQKNPSRIRLDLMKNVAIVFSEGKNEHLEKKNEKTGSPREKITTSDQLT
jgi:hypothetical protein